MVDASGATLNGAAAGRDRPQRQQRKRLRPVYLDHYADGEVCISLTNVCGSEKRLIAQRLGQLAQLAQLAQAEVCSVCTGTLQALDMLRLSQAEDGDASGPAAGTRQGSPGVAALAELPEEFILPGERQSEPHSTQQEEAAKHAPYEPEADEQEALLSDVSPQLQKCAPLACPTRGPLMVMCTFESALSLMTRKRGRGKTEQEKAAAAAAKEREKAQKKAAREQARAEKAAQRCADPLLSICKVRICQADDGLAGNGRRHSLGVSGSLIPYRLWTLLMGYAHRHPCDSLQAA